MESRPLTHFEEVRQRLNLIRNTLDALRNLPECPSALRNWIRPEDLNQEYNNWIQLLSQLSGTERDFFKPHWVPVHYGDETIFVDLESPHLRTFTALYCDSDIEDIPPFEGETYEIIPICDSFNELPFWIKEGISDSFWFRFTTKASLLAGLRVYRRRAEMVIRAGRRFAPFQPSELWAIQSLPYSFHHTQRQFSACGLGLCWAAHLPGDLPFRLLEAQDLTFPEWYPELKYHIRNLHGWTYCLKFSTNHQNARLRYIIGSGSNAMLVTQHRDHVRITARKAESFKPVLSILRQLQSPPPPSKEEVRENLRLLREEGFEWEDLR